MENNLKFGGIYRITHCNSQGEVISVDEVKNIVPNQGLQFFNNVIFGGQSSSSFYIGLYANNYTPVAGDTMASFVTSASEIVGYNEVTRPAYTAVVNTVNVSNTASKATFNVNLTATARGAFLSTSSIKNGTAGSLISASLFSSPKSLTAGDTLTVEYIFTGSST